MLCENLIAPGFEPSASALFTSLTVDKLLILTRHPHLSNSIISLSIHFCVNNFTELKCHIFAHLQINFIIICVTIFLCVNCLQLFETQFIVNLSATIIYNNNTNIHNNNNNLITRDHRFR